MFHGLHEELLKADLDLETKILVTLVCDRFDNYSGEFKEVNFLLWNHVIKLEIET